MHRWRICLVATLALTGVGLLFAQPTLLAAAVIPLIYVCYGTLSVISDEPALRATRELSPAVAIPGESVTVRVTIKNTGDRVLPDVRAIDGVPELALTAGSPRGATALAPEEELTLEYSVISRRGSHAFERPLVNVRPLSASEPVTVTPDVTGDTSLICRTSTDGQSAGATSAGTPEHTSGGIEFHATRQYRRGDPMRRIDWRHLAKTGEFVTVQYREQQPARTAIGVDIRPASRVQATPLCPSGAALSVDVAARIQQALDRIDALTGVGAVGLDPENSFGGPHGTAWAVAGTGGTEPAVFLHALQSLLADDSEQPSDTPPRDESSGAKMGSDQRRTALRADGQGVHNDWSAERLLELFPSDSRVILCTPLLDEWPVTFARTVTDRGYDLTVVSPNITEMGGLEGRVVEIDRQRRLRAVGHAGEAIDWTPGEPLDIGGESV